jgi:ribosomal protein L13E
LFAALLCLRVVVLLLVPIRCFQADALGQFGVLPKGVDLIVMDQLKCAVTSDGGSGGAEGFEGGKAVFLVRGGGGLISQGAAAVPIDISPSEFEEAVSGQAAARHAYLDDLEAAILRIPALYQTAIDQSDYDVAAKILAIRPMMQSILSGISKPRSKNAIKASLDAGVLVLVEELDAANFLQLTECLAEKSDVENQIAAAQKSAALQTAQLLQQEKSAAARQDFAAANQFKAAKEASTQAGIRDVNQLKVCSSLKLSNKHRAYCFLYVFGCSVLTLMQARLPAIIQREAKLSTKSQQLKQRADAILNRRISNFSAYCQLQEAIVKAKTAGYDVAAFRAAGCDWATIKTAGFTVAEVKAAGCDFLSARAAGFDLPSLRNGGYDVAAFRAAGCDWATVITAGFTLAEVKAAGCDPASAQSAGYDVSPLVSAFGYDAVVASGCDFSSVQLVSFLFCSSMHPRS